MIMSIPVKLHQAGSGMGTSLPANGQETRRSSLQQPVTSTIDMKASQVFDRYQPRPPVKAYRPG